MAGLEPQTPIPTELKLHQASRAMAVRFADGTSFRMAYESGPCAGTRLRASPQNAESNRRRDERND